MKIANYHQYLYPWGVKGGVPFGLLRGISDTVDYLRHYRESRMRERIAKDLCLGSRWAKFVDSRLAYRLFEPGEISPCDRLAAFGAKIFSRLRYVEDTERAKVKKSPITHLLERLKPDELAHLVELATAPEIVEIMCGYFGTVPRFDNADIWVSRSSDQNMGSQLFHLDKPDRRYTSLFINLVPVDEECGPFTFFDKPISDGLRKSLRYEKRYYLGDGRLTDEEVFGQTSKGKLIRLTGPVGSGAIVDTSECIHFGSRSIKAERALMRITYMSPNKPGSYRFSEFKASPHRDPLVKMVL